VAFEVSIPTTLSAAPGKLNFGKVDASTTSKPRKVTLANRGKNPALISLVLLYPPFPVTFTIATGTDTCSGKIIPPKRSCSFEVEYTPTNVGNMDGGIAVVAYNGTSPEIELEGIGLAVALKAPKSESFAPESPGSIGTPKSIEISNPSTATVTLGTAMIGGSDPSSFKIASDQCSGLPLAPKGKCSVGMEFTPPGNASGTQSATLAVPFTYGANQDAVATNLTGKVK
jgi:hypothetical protein